MQYIHLQYLYKEVVKINKVKPCNLRFTIDTRRLHPYAEYGRLREFARRNGVTLRRLWGNLADTKQTFSTHKRREGYDIPQQN